MARGTAFVFSAVLILGTNPAQASAFMEYEVSARAHDPCRLQLHSLWI